MSNQNSINENSPLPFDHPIEKARREREQKEKDATRSGLYYVIPSQVMEDKEIDCSEKMLYALISGLAHNNGYAYASNKHYAERIGCSEREIKNKIQKLEKRGYIRRDTKKDGLYWERKIFVCHSHVSKKVYEGSFESLPMGTSKGTVVPFGGAPQCPIVSKGLVSESSSSPPQKPKEAKKNPDLSKEEEEEVKKRIESRKSTERIRDPHRYREKVLENLIIEKSQEKTRAERIERHKKQAEGIDGKIIEGISYTACSNRLEITKGIYYKALLYEISDTEWDNEFSVIVSYNKNK